MASTHDLLGFCNTLPLYSFTTPSQAAGEAVPPDTKHRKRALTLAINNLPSPQTPSPKPRWRGEDEGGEVGVERGPRRTGDAGRGTEEEF